MDLLENMMLLWGKGKKEGKFGIVGDKKVSPTGSQSCYMALVCTPILDTNQNIKLLIKKPSI